MWRRVAGCVRYLKSHIVLRLSGNIDAYLIRSMIRNGTIKSIRNHKISCTAVNWTKREDSTHATFFIESASRRLLVGIGDQRTPPIPQRTGLDTI